MSTLLSDKAERVGDAAAGFASNVKADASHAGANFGEDLRQLKDELLAAIHGNKSAVVAAETHSTTREAIGEIGHAIKADANRIIYQAEDYVAERPLKVIGVSLAVGFILGAFWAHK